LKISDLAQGKVCHASADLLFFEQNEHEMSRFWSGDWTPGRRTFVLSNEFTYILSLIFFKQ